MSERWRGFETTSMFAFPQGVITRCPPHPWRMQLDTVAEGWHEVSCQSGVKQQNSSSSSLPCEVQQMGVKTNSPIYSFTLKNKLLVDVKLWVSLCSGVIGLKWTLWVCPRTEALFVMSVSWGNQNTLSWLPQKGDIIAQAKRSVSLRSQETILLLLPSIRVFYGDAVALWEVFVSEPCSILSFP